MPTAKDVATWMRDEVQKSELYQDDAAASIERIFGAEFTYMNDGGGIAIDKKVLREFKRLTVDTVVWERSLLCWRLRSSTDDEGRGQY